MQEPLDLATSPLGDTGGTVQVYQERHKTFFLIALFITAKQAQDPGTTWRLAVELKLGPYSWSCSQLHRGGVEGTPATQCACQYGAAAGGCTVPARSGFLPGASRLPAVAKISAQPNGIDLFQS